MMGLLQSMIITTVITLSSFAAVASLSYPNLARSSFVNTREDNALLGHVFVTHVTQSILTCAQLCLGQSLCLSFNFNTLLGNANVCELNDKSQDSKHELQKRKGSIFGWWIKVQLHQYTFTCLDGSGPTGPRATSGYKGTPLEGTVRLDQGIQYWKVPFSGTYTIEVFGASGANGTYSSNLTHWRRGGLGARAKGTFWFYRGTELSILVGQAGLPVYSFPDRPGGGGGGTFVVQGKDIPLIIAGGGGGGGISKSYYTDGDPGQISSEGSRHGGSSGSGGKLFDPSTNQTSRDILAGSGAGFIGDGNTLVGTAAKSFVNGGEGGKGVDPNGGFGGGGMGMSQGGGGGGYSGGGVTGNNDSGTAGGGGSYNAGWSQENTAGVNKGDGWVVVTHVN